MGEVVPFKAPELRLTRCGCGRDFWTSGKGDGAQMCPVCMVRDTLKSDAEDVCIALDGVVAFLQRAIASEDIRATERAYELLLETQTKARRIRYRARRM